VKSNIRFQARSARFAGLITIAVAVPCALALAACGGKQRPAPSYQLPGNRVAPHQDGADSIDETLAELDAYPCPDGVEPALWEMLKNGLVSSLQQHAPSYDKLPCSGNTEKLRVDYRFDGLVFYGPILWGDGSRNGVVDIPDLSLIAINWGCEIDECEMYLDYDNNGQVGISDVSVLARNWGQRGDTYAVEWSLSSEGPWNLAEATHYGEFSETVLVCEHVPISENTYLGVWEPYVKYFAFLDVHGQRHMYARVTKAHHEGQAASYETITVAFSDPHRPPAGRVRDLDSVPDKDNTITWSTQQVMADGNQNGITEILDIEIVFANYGKDVFEHPLAAVADYNGDGLVFTGDHDYVYIDWGCCTERFVVEVSAESADTGFWTDGEVDYFEDCAGYTEYGFRYYEYQLQSPPEAPYWVRVTPWFEDMSGIPCEAIEMGGEI